MAAAPVTPITDPSPVVPFAPDFMSLEELAARMGISISLAYQLARAGKMPVPAIRPGRRFLFSRKAYEALLDVQHDDAA